MAVPLSWKDKVYNPKITTLNEERAATRREGQLLHRGDVMMQNLNTHTHTIIESHEL